MAGGQQISSDALAKRLLRAVEASLVSVYPVQPPGPRFVSSLYLDLRRVLKEYQRTDPRSDLAESLALSLFLALAGEGLEVSPKMLAELRATLARALEENAIGA